MIRRRLVSIGIAALAGIAGVADLSLKAASSPPPTVNITRITALNQRVWPGDFNGDGITDLVGTSSTGDVVITPGKGDGTFGTPSVWTYADRGVLAVADFNKDGKLDLVIAQTGGTSSADVSVLAGNGDGTFGTAYTLASVPNLTNALAADLDGDGNLDIVVLTDGTMFVYPGKGDFTFGAPVALTTGALPLDGAVADLNGDGRKDIVVANHFSDSISIFLNQGGLTFTASDMPLDLNANDVVARDVNGDGKMDLVVAVSETHSSAGPDFSIQGFAYVLLGNGNGTFAQPV